ncbi:MAG: RNA-binding S4 domain-containing protein [Pseudomonadota bacterium]|nr:RNA-binding S4 domain-containing protein [Pseudomonadota bacterium]
MEKFRLDKWLWAARLYKTRGLAAEAIGKGRIVVNGVAAKAARELHEGDVLDVRQAASVRTLVVRALSRLRGPAAVAQTYYEETPESVERRLAAAALRRDQSEPAAALEAGRPTKRNRRQLADWNRWSATAEPD